MSAAAVVTLIGVGLTVAALAISLISVVVMLRHVSFTLGTIIVGLRAIAFQAEPLGHVIGDINRDLGEVRTALEDLIEAKTGERPSATVTPR